MYKQQYQNESRKYLSNSSVSTPYLKQFNSYRSSGYDSTEFVSNEMRQNRRTDFLDYLTDFFTELVQALQSMKSEMYKMIGIETAPQMNLLLSSKEIRPEMVSIIDASKSCLQDLKRIEALMKGYVIGRQSSAYPYREQDKDLNLDPYTFCIQKQSETEQHDLQSIQDIHQTDYPMRRSNLVVSKLQVNQVLSQELTQEDQKIANQNQALKRELQILTEAIKNQLSESKIVVDEIDFRKETHTDSKLDYESLTLIKLLKQEIARNLKVKQNNVQR